MGNARARGSYEERKANPQGRVLNPSLPDAKVIGFVDPLNPDPLKTRAKSGGYRSADGRTAYALENGTLRRLTRRGSQAQNGQHS
jgi:hypothetical protein